MIAAGQIDHPGWGQPVSLSQAFIRRQAVWKWMLEKCMKFCELKLSKAAFLTGLYCEYMCEWMSVCVSAWETARLHIWNQCFNPVRKPVHESHMIHVCWVPLEERRFRNKVFWLKTLFVRQTVELAQTGGRPQWPMAQVKIVAFKPEMSKILVLT